VIGPNLRKALRWAAIAYVLFGASQVIYLMMERAQQPEYAVPVNDRTIWISSAGGLVAAFVQAGILLALLSIDERLEARK
jgi:hypothetical protein